MKNNLIFFLSILMISSCDNSDVERPECAAVQCEFVSTPVKIRYVNKATNSPLLAPGSQYTLADLKVIGKANSNYKPEVKIDSGDPSVIIVRPVFGGEVLTLGNYSADNISMQTKARNKECCSPMDVISLIINGEVICAPCNDLDKTIAVIKK
ncbi:MAG: hypothetical protein V4708_18335 [Bacteroidota bacterium]